MITSMTSGIPGGFLINPPPYVIVLPPESVRVAGLELAEGDPIDQLHAMLLNLLFSVTSWIRTATHNKAVQVSGPEHNVQLGSEWSSFGNRVSHCAVEC